MIRMVGALAVVLALSGAVVAEQTADYSIVPATQIGPLRLGMRAAEAARALPWPYLRWDTYRIIDKNGTRGTRDAIVWLALDEDPPQYYWQAVADDDRVMLVGTSWPAPHRGKPLGGTAADAIRTLGPPLRIVPTSPYSVLLSWDGLAIMFDSDPSDEEHKDWQGRVAYVFARHQWSSALQIMLYGP